MRPHGGVVTTAAALLARFLVDLGAVRVVLPPVHPVVSVVRARPAVIRALPAAIRVSAALHA